MSKTSFEVVGKTGMQRIEVPGGWIYSNVTGHEPLGVFVPDPKQSVLALVVACMAAHVATDPQSKPEDREIAEKVIRVLS